MKSTSGKDTVMIAEMTAKDLEYYINLIDKAPAGFEMTDSNFEGSYTVGKYNQTNHSWKESMNVTNFFVVLF